MVLFSRVSLVFKCECSVWMCLWTSLVQMEYKCYYSPSRADRATYEQKLRFTNANMDPCTIEKRQLCGNTAALPDVTFPDICIGPSSNPVYSLHTTMKIHKSM